MRKLAKEITFVNKAFWEVTEHEPITAAVFAFDSRVASYRVTNAAADLMDLLTGEVHEICCRLNQERP